MEGQVEASQKQSKEQLQQQSVELQVHVQLPTGETASVWVKRSSSVRDLKMMVELNSGVPSDLFTLVHRQSEGNTIALEDETKMADIGARRYHGSVTLELNIPQWWQRFVDRCMKRDNRQILKRITIKMNQISCEERAFVAAFIAAQKGDGQLFQSLLDSDVKIDVQQTVQCSGRTLLHAAVAGENFSCAAAIFMNDGSSLLSTADQQGITPMDMAKKSNDPSLVTLFDKYVELEARESSEDDFDVGTSSETDSTSGNDGNDVDEDEKSNLQFEESERKDQVYQNGSKEKSVVRDAEQEDIGQTKGTKSDLNKRFVRQHVQLRAAKSLNTQERPFSARARLICAEEIRPLTSIIVSGAKQTEEKLPRVNSAAPSPMNSPRMGRKLVPSLLNTERPGSPILRPRSPTMPFPKSPTSPRARSPFVTNPDSPRTTRKEVPIPVSTKPQRTRASTYSARENRVTRTRKMSHEMKEFLMEHCDQRENKPWNAWKTVRKNPTNQFDESDDNDDDSSSEDENETLARFLQTSRRRKTFEMWLTDKEAQMAREKLLLAEKARQDATVNRREANWRQLTFKTHGEWLKAKEEFRTEEALRGKHSEEGEEGEEGEKRKVAAMKKYQEWLRSKDAEALAQEDRLRREANEKFLETKQKREEKMQRAWFKKNLSSTS